MIPSPAPGPALPRWATRSLPAGACALLASTAALAAAAPVHVQEAPGWPRADVAGILMPHPAGGVVEATSGLVRSWPSMSFTDAGRVRWTNSHVPACSNCEGVSVPRLLRDGRYGPIGPLWSGAWSVTRSGATAPSCVGDVTASGWCVEDGTRPANRVTVVGTRGADPGWTYQDPSFIPAFDDGSAIAPVVVDDGGTAYASYARDVGSGSLLIALDATTGAVRWRREAAAAQTLEAGTPLTGLKDGFLLAVRSSDTRVVSYASTGAVRWTLRRPEWVDGVVVDAARGRAYVNYRSAARSVAAVNLSSGAAAWISPAGVDTRALSAGPAGVLLAVDTPTSHELRAVDAAGRARWVWTSATPVASALATSPRRVFASAPALTSDAVGLLHALDVVPGPARGTRAALSLVRTPSAEADCSARAA